MKQSAAAKAPDAGLVDLLAALEAREQGNFVPALKEILAAALMKASPPAGR